MTDHHDHDHYSEAVDPATLDDTQALCPVTGEVVDKQEAEKLGHVREYGGQKYYFCCSTCVHLFDANPEDYAVKQD